MTKQFNNLLKNIPDERKQRIETKKREILKEIDLQNLRQAFELTQNQLADTLKVNQAAISKMENQSDMYISTLRRFIGAMGGKLKIVAEFPDHEIVINQFEEIGTQSEASVQQV